MICNDDWRDAPPNEQYACNAIVDHGIARRLASKILSPECFTDPVLRAATKCLLLSRVDESSRRTLESAGFSWHGLRLGFRWRRKSWAVAAIRSLARANAATLLPATLNWAADALDHEHPVTVLCAVNDAFRLAGWSAEGVIDGAA